MSAGISVREFARRDGCDDKLVRRAIASGKLQPFPDGTLDPELVSTGWRKSNRRGADSADTPAGSPQPVRTDDEVSASGEDGAPVDDAALDNFIAKLLSGRFVSLVEAERVKENGIALKHMLDARRKAGELVDIETARTVLFETARAARDAWLSWPSRVGPLIAAQLGLQPEPVIEALTAHVHQQLADLGEPEDDFGDASSG